MVNKFLAPLRELSEHYDFADFLDEAIRDRFVCDLRINPIHSWLLNGADLTLANATKIAAGIEAADQLYGRLQTPSEKVEIKAEVCRTGKKSRKSTSRFTTNESCHRFGKKETLMTSVFTKKKKTKCHG